MADPSDTQLLTETTRQPSTHAAREWVGMAVVGATSVVVDFALFNALLAVGTGPAIANLVAIVAATLFAFWANLRWSFAHRSSVDARTAVVQFFVVNLVSAGVVELAVIGTALLTTDSLLLNVSKFLATLVTTVARFFAYRHWVYRDRSQLGE